MKTNFFKIIVLLLGLPIFGWSQIELSSIVKAKNKVDKNNFEAAKLSSIPLELPFWDDFSNSDGFPKDSIWLSGPFGFNTEINPGTGINAPTINVATFNGSKGDGLPYSLGVFDEGATDTLTSQPINLSTYTAADELYLSYYYQFTGNGNEPNDSDNFILDFKDKDGIWNLAVWDTLGINFNRSDTFFIKVIPVLDSKYHHDNFQFRFRAEGRQSGPYDTWNLDYVYLNKERSANDTFSPDKGLTNPVSSPFFKYTGIPIQHYFNKTVPDDLLEVLDFDIYNLDVETIFGVKATLEYTNTAYTGGVPNATSHLLEELGGTAASAVTSRELRHVSGTNTIDEATFDPAADSIAIQIQVSLNEDNPNNYEPKHAPLDFSINDSIQFDVHLNNYYAYDDGTAEWGSGVSGEGSMLAQKFGVVGGAPEDRHIVGVQIYFPYIGTNPSPERIDIKIWENGSDGHPGDLMYVFPTNIVGSTALNEFQYYEFNWSTAAPDTFHIGYEQYTINRISVGTDRNFNNGDKMYYNLNDVWIQNEFVRGSLMIRPVFGPEKSNVTTINPKNTSPALYPNPTNGPITLHNFTGSITVYDTSGRIYSNVSVQQDGTDLQLDLGALPNGIYLLRATSKQQTYQYKVTLNQ